MGDILERLGLPDEHQTCKYGSSITIRNRCWAASFDRQAAECGGDSLGQVGWCRRHRDAFWAGVWPDRGL
jgi:hypothetical protein